MSKSIASKALAIAQKNEVKRLKSVKEEFLNKMRKKLDNHINRYEPWTAIGATSYLYTTSIFDDFSTQDLITIGNEVGFNITRDHVFQGRYSISVPEWVKGQRKTQAQLMVYRCNAEIKKRIQSEKKRAQKICKEVLQKVKDGDFKSCKHYSDTYTITVNMPCANPYNIFLEEATNILKKRNFNLLSIDPKTGLWQLEVSEN